MILSKDIDDQRILPSDWMKGTISNPQSKVVVSDATYTWWFFHTKNLRYQLIASRDIDDQWILKSDWLFICSHFPRHEAFTKSSRTLLCTIFRVKRLIHGSPAERGRGSRWGLVATGHLRVRGPQNIFKKLFSDFYQKPSLFLVVTFNMKFSFFLGKKCDII